MHIGADTHQIPAAAPLKCQAHAADVMVEAPEAGPNGPAENASQL